LHYSSPVNAASIKPARTIPLYGRDGALLPSAFNVSRVRTDLCGLAPRRLGAKRPSLLAVLPSLLPSPFATGSFRVIQAHSGLFKVIQAKSTLKKLSGPRPRFTPLLPGLQPVRPGSPIDGGSLGDEVCASHPLRLIGRDFPPSMPIHSASCPPKSFPASLCVFLSAIALATADAPFTLCV
jgi:hypothetical protein